MPCTRRHLRLVLHNLLDRGPLRHPSMPLLPICCEKSLVSTIITKSGRGSQRFTQLAVQKGITPKRRTKLGRVPLALEWRHDWLNVFVPHEERQIDICAFIAHEPPAL